MPYELRALTRDLVEKVEINKVTGQEEKTIKLCGACNEPFLARQAILVEIPSRKVLHVKCVLKQVPDKQLEKAFERIKKEGLVDE